MSGVKWRIEYPLDIIPFLYFSSNIPCISGWTMAVILDLSDGPEWHISVADIYRTESWVDSIPLEKDLNTVPLYSCNKWIKPALSQLWKPFNLYNSL